MTEKFGICRGNGEVGTEKDTYPGSGAPLLPDLYFQ